MQIGLRKRKLKNMSLSWQELAFPLHFPCGRPEAASRTSICPSCAPWAPPFGRGPRTGNGPGTFQDCSTGWQVQETCLGPGICSLTWPPQDGPIRVVLSSRTRHCQQEAENQCLPGTGSGYGWYLGLKRSVLLPPPQVSCTAAQMPRETAHGIQKLRQPERERLKLQQHDAGS